MILGEVAELRVIAHNTISTMNTVMLEQLYGQWPRVTVEGVAVTRTSAELERSDKESFKQEQWLYVCMLGEKNMSNLSMIFGCSKKNHTWTFVYHVFCNYP